LANGLLDFLAPASQTDTVQNVAKSQANFHFNQFQSITAFATDGITKIRKLYRQCAQFAGKPNGGPDIIVMDDDTFGNYQDAKLDLVRLTALPQGTDKGNLLQDVIGVGGVYASALINLSTDFTAAPAAGVTYMINTDFLELVYIQKMTISDFTDQIAQQDAELVSAGLLPDPDPGLLRRSSADYVRHWRTRFDYLLLLNADLPDAAGGLPDLPELELLEDAGFVRLYRIDRPALAAR
jgi:hypothetical protein